jgi:uncharacterized protein YciI
MNSEDVEDSLDVVDFPSHDDAENWAQQDPYVAANIDRQVTVKPFQRMPP